MADTITSNLEMLSALGLYTGLGDIWLAKMKKEDTASTPPEYDTPFLAMEGITVGLTPTYAEGSQMASNRQIRKIKTLTGMDVSVEYPRVTPEVRCAMLGRMMDANGGEHVADGMAPLFAVGVMATRDDGSSHMRWIYKVRFAEGSVSMQTEQEGQIAYQIPTIEGSGVRLAYETDGDAGRKEHMVQYEMDTANAKCKLEPTQFFASVQGPWTAENA